MVYYQTEFVQFRYWNLNNQENVGGPRLLEREERQLELSLIGFEQTLTFFFIKTSFKA